MSLHVLAVAGLLLRVGVQPPAPVPAGRAQVHWRINENNTLFWDNQPYLPVGLRIDGSAGEIDEAKSLGLHDVLVDQSAISGWSATIERLEISGLRYLLSISSLAPSAQGIAVEPEGYRISDIKEERDIDLKIEGATSALVVLALQRDASVQWSKRLNLEGGRLKIKVDPQSTLEHVLLIYPILQDSGEPDFWEGFDRLRDDLLQRAAGLSKAQGCRGLVNPLGQVLQFPNDKPKFVPTSHLFRLELEAHLRHKYATLPTALRAWSLQASDLESFAQMAQLVPLWTSNRGVSQLWNPSSDRMHPCESKRSSAWRDISEVIRNAATRRIERLTASMQRITGVPVVQDWRGWTGPYENPQSTVGIGMNMIGSSPAKWIDSGCRAAASALRASSPVWLLATQIDVVGDKDMGSALADELNDAASLGARGWFISTKSATVKKALSVEANRMSKDLSYAQWKPGALFYPESAMNPAAPMRLTGGKWWLPSPAPGNRIDLGPDFGAYRLEDGSASFFTLWTTSATKRVKLAFTDPKKVSVTTLDGHDPKIKIVKKSIELDLTPSPIVISGTDEVPVPEEAISAEIKTFERLMKLGGEALALSDETFIFKSLQAGVERNPGASFLAMRQLNDRLAARLGNYLWIEAEASRTQNFSETASIAGISNGSGLVMRSRVQAPPEGYHAAYDFTCRRASVMVAWLAMNIHADQVSAVSLKIGDQTLKSLDGPIGLYSQGFGWYRFGELSIPKGTSQVQIHVDAPNGTDIVFDSIVLAPPEFRPDGIRKPIP